MPKTDKHVIVALILTAFLLLTSTWGGVLTINTTPGSSFATNVLVSTNTNGAVMTNTNVLQYLPISKYDAMTGGVQFTGNAAVTNGGVNSNGAWHWTFANGSNSTASNAAAGTILFGTNAYGNANACSAGVTHIGSSNETCSVSSSMVLTMYVNDIKPSLIFDTTDPWASNDASYQNNPGWWNNGTPVPGVPYYELIKDSNDVPFETNYVLPYQYVYTNITPVNSGALTNLMDIWETTATQTDIYYDQYSNIIKEIALSRAATSYVAIGHFSATNIGNSSPPNPIGFGVDSPGPMSIGQIQSRMAGVYSSQTHSYVPAAEFQSTIKLTSYPTYNYLSGSQFDTSVAVSHIFVFTLTAGSNGTGPFNWSTTNYPTNN